MENKYYYVEIASLKQGTWYKVELLDFTKLQNYFLNSIMEYQKTQMYDIWSKIKFNGEEEVQYLMTTEVIETDYGSKDGNVYIAYALSEEEALGKVIIYG